MTIPNDLNRLVGINSTRQIENANQCWEGVMTYALAMGMDKPHRLAQFLAQLSHESGAFLYMHEIWGPTAAQKRYEGRKDLGNTRTGDGSKFRGRGPIQLTGRDNYTRFYHWAVANSQTRGIVPNFTTTPEAILDDAWLGATAMWFWDVGNMTGKSLNIYADKGDIETITRKINGGLNGYDDRCWRYSAIALKLLGYSSVSVFQHVRNLTPDGVAGPITRREMHIALTELKQSPLTAPTLVVDSIPIPPDWLRSPPPTAPAVSLADRIKMLVGRWFQ